MNILINGLNYLLLTNEFNTILKLILIVILSGIVGYEREAWNKPAGFRTHILVGISATLVMICGEYIYNNTGADPTRIPAQLLSGIGFLGAGTILRDGFNVRGLTTAAALLAVACIGLAVGAGYFMGAIVSTIIVFFVLKNSRTLSDKFDHFSILDLSIKSSNAKEVIDEIKRIVETYNLEIVKIKIENDTIRLLSRYKERIDANAVIASIAKTSNVDEVVEILER